MTHHFNYRDGALYAEDVAIAEIADAVGTPFYCYSDATLRRHFRVFKEAFTGLNTLTAYSIKANSNLAVIRTLAREGAGADVVSGGELHRALEAGVPGEKIVFSGVGKTQKEMAAALDARVWQFNVESEAELYALNQVAIEKGVRAPIAFRVNPDVAAGGHEKISTGKAEDKFGVAWSRARALYEDAGALPGVHVCGVDVHIGSQITDLKPFEAAFKKVAGLVETLRADGFDIERVDVGGGLGVPYQEGSAPPPDPADYAAMVRRVAEPLNVQLIFEPGRMIVANAGILVAKVIYDKKGDARRFLIVDAAMNDLIRPTLYDAYHEIKPVREATDKNPLVAYDVVGPVCETGDKFATERRLPEQEAGELVAFMSAGAYGAVQACQYNTRPLAPEVMVKGDAFSIVRRRPSLDEILALEASPPWLSNDADDALRGAASEASAQEPSVEKPIAASNA